MAGGPFFLWHDSGSRCLRLRALLRCVKNLTQRGDGTSGFCLRNTGLGLWSFTGLRLQHTCRITGFFWIFAIDLKQCISRISTPQNVSYWTFPCYFFQNRNARKNQENVSLLWRCSAGKWNWHTVNHLWRFGLEPYKLNIKLRWIL